MDYLSIANSFPMWLCVIPPILLVIVQAVLFAKKAYRAGLEIGMTKEQLNSAIRSSAFASFGPSLVILSGMLALIVIAGGPIGWMRLAYIGNVMFEALAFNFGVTASGATAETITAQAFTNGVWVMILGSLGWIIFSILFTDKMDRVQNKISGGNPRTMQIIAAAAMIGGMGSLSCSYVVQLNKNAVATIGGAAIMVLIYAFNSKKNIKWLREWALTFGLLGGMIIAVII